MNCCKTWNEYQDKGIKDEHEWKEYISMTNKAKKWIETKFDAKLKCTDIGYITYLDYCP